MNSDKIHDNIQSTTVTSSISQKTNQLTISDNSSWFTVVPACIFSDLLFLVRILAVSLPHCLSTNLRSRSKSCAISCSTDCDTVRI